MQLIFVELPKLKRTISELKTLTDKWIYFLKEAASLDGIPESLKEVSEIEFALHLANQANMTTEELELVDRRGMMLQDEKGRITYAEQKGERKVIMRLLKKRFGEITAAITSKIEALPLADLESLTEEICIFRVGRT